MDEIKRIAPDSAIGKVGRSQTHDQNSVEELRQEKADKAAGNKDSLQVDQLRKEEAHIIENSRLLLDELPEVRSDKVALAKQRLAEGFYDKKEVLNQTAAKLIKEKDEVADQNIQQVRNNLAKGYYDNPDVLNQTAGNILKDID